MLLDWSVGVLEPINDQWMEGLIETNWGCAFCWLTQWHLVCPYFVAFSSNTGSSFFYQI